MKKFLSISLSILCIFNMTACGNSTEKVQNVVDKLPTSAVSENKAIKTDDESKTSTSTSVSTETTKLSKEQLTAKYEKLIREYDYKHISMTYDLKKDDNSARICIKTAGKDTYMSVEAPAQIIKIWALDDYSYLYCKKESEEGRYYCQNEKSDAEAENDSESLLSGSGMDIGIDPDETYIYSRTEQEGSTIYDIVTNVNKLDGEDAEGIEIWINRDTEEIEWLKSVGSENDTVVSVEKCAEITKPANTEQYELWEPSKLALAFIGVVYSIFEEFGEKEDHNGEINDPAQPYVGENDGEDDDYSWIGE